VSFIIYDLSSPEGIITLVNVVAFSTIRPTWTTTVSSVYATTILPVCLSVCVSIDSLHLCVVAKYIVRVFSPRTCQDNHFLFSALSRLM